MRQPGGGRRKKIEEDPDRLGALESLVEPSTHGDPESALRWTCKSLRVLAEDSNRQARKAESEITLQPRKFRWLFKYVLSTAGTGKQKIDLRY